MRRVLPIGLMLLAFLAVGCSKKSSEEQTSTGAVLRNVIVSSGQGTSSDVAYPTSQFVAPTAPEVPTVPSYGVVTQQPAVTVPPWCVRRIGPYGEIILDPSDPAFDCSHGCTPPFSSCSQVQTIYVQEPAVAAPRVLQYQGNAAYPYPPVTHPAALSTPLSINDSFLQGLTATAYAQVAEPVEADLPTTVDGDGQDLVAGAAGTNRLSLPSVIFRGGLTCGQGFTMPVLVGGEAPLSACVAESPWTTRSEWMDF